MELESMDPLVISRFEVSEHRARINDLKKKRKLEAELLGLPTAKHKCGDGSLPLSKLNEKSEVEDFNTTIIKGKAEGGAFDDGSEHESARDSNSFVEDSDSTMSGPGESKFEAENGKTWPYQKPSTSLYHWSSSSFNESSYSSDSTALTEGVVDKEHFAFAGEEQHHSLDVDEVHMDENFDDSEYGCASHIDDLCLGYGKDGGKQYIEKEIQDILYSKEANPNDFVLSSGRWSVNQEAQRGKRKPTIDQEFEQYFSMLML